MAKAAPAFTPSCTWSRGSHPSHPRPRDHLLSKSQQTSKYVLMARSDHVPVSKSNHHIWLGQTWLPDPVTVGKRQKHLDQIRQSGAEPRCLGEYNPTTNQEKNKIKPRLLPQCRRNGEELLGRPYGVHGSSSSERIPIFPPSSQSVNMGFWN